MRPILQSLYTEPLEQCKKKEFISSVLSKSIGMYNLRKTLLHVTQQHTRCIFYKLAPGTNKTADNKVKCKISFLYTSLLRITRLIIPMHPSSAHINYLTDDEYNPHITEIEKSEIKKKKFR